MLWLESVTILFQERFGDSTSWLLLLHDNKNDPTLNIWHLKLICLLFQPHMSWDSPVSRHICQPATDPRSHVEEVPKVKKAIKFQPQPLSKPRPTLIPDCWNLAHIQQSLIDLAKIGNPNHLWFCTLQQKNWVVYLISVSGIISVGSAYDFARIALCTGNY